LQALILFDPPEVIFHQITAEILLAFAMAIAKDISFDVAGEK